VLKRAFLAACSLWLIVAPRLSGQERGAAALGDLVESIGTTTRVLMIGAHPDDEDTQLIAYLAKARHVETAYLSLTRGDGGQNLIGNELGPVLGMIRTEELLAARRIDGGRQYFTRAFDFGFSKTIEETYEHWPRDSILEDMVAIVRAFRPQVIVSVWSGTPADGHGHHQYAGVLAREVFDAAADSVRFPAAAVHGLQPWTVAKFYRSARRFGGGTAPGATLMFDVGEFDPLLGRTYSEIATESRSQHRSQGQGGLPEPGPRFDAVRLEVSRVSDPHAAERGLFDGLDTSWLRFKSLPLADSVRTALDSLALAERGVVRSENLVRPAPMVEPLATYLRLASRAAAGVACVPLEPLNGQVPCAGASGDLALALASTRDRATQALLNAAGVRVEATAPRELIAEGDTMPVTVSVYNEGTSTVSLESLSLTNQLSVASKQPRTILPDSIARQTLPYRGSAAPTLPWWLRRRPIGDMFDQSSADMVTGEDRLHDSGVEVGLRVDGVPVPVRVGPIVYRFADRARGEVRRPVSTVPEISVLLEHEVEYARATAPFDRTMLVFVRSAATTPRDIDVSLALPAGLAADTATRHITLPAFGNASLYFRLRGRLPAGRHQITATATSHGERFATGFVPIEYEHIRPQRYYRPSTVQIEAVNATFANLRIGYIRGVGDNVMPMLEELGLSVVELDPATLPQVKLSGFTTIVIGSRAYDANSAALLANTPLLLRFAREGGTVVAQYGQNMSQPGILPYPVSRTVDRVTDESAPVRVVDPGSPLLAAPNRIGDADFANWVQERASYMPHTFDKQYRTVFSMNDKNEPPNDAAVLIAPVGKGAYVYTTLSFFRQLPAGNPGAARLFINLLSANPRAANRPEVPAAGQVRP
jgi:LmbE family N-acetylglucosaminyl deacetylase